MNKIDSYKFKKEHAEKDNKEIVVHHAVAAVVLMRRKYQNIQRNFTTRLILLNKQINYLLIRVAAFSLPLHVKSNAHIKVKK